MHRMCCCHYTVLAVVIYPSISIYHSIYLSPFNRFHVARHPNIVLDLDALVGATSGELYKFKGIELQSIVPAHTRSVAALDSCTQGVVSGGRDGLIKLWSLDLECLQTFNVSNQSPIKSLVWHIETSKLLVGTRDSMIVEVNARDGSLMNIIMDMHFTGDVQGLTMSPTKGMIYDVCYVSMVGCTHTVVCVCMDIILRLERETRASRVYYYSI
jgi:WD40 repeat protein